MSVGAALGGFAVVALLITLVPGMDTMLVLRSALASRRSHAVATALGICTGALLWGAAAAVGAAALLGASQLAFRVLTLAGAAYVVWLGLSLLVRSARTADHTGDGAGGSAWGSSAARCFARGLWTNLLNPKIGVFYVATIPQFLVAGVPRVGMGLLLAAVHVAISLVWFTFVVLGASYARRWLTSPAGRRAVDAVAGVALVGLGLRLALQHGRG